MTQDEIQEIRNQLREFIPYEKGKRLREQLNKHAIENYEQKFPDSDYILFMERNIVSFDINHAQSSNHPYYYTMFSVLTQHIMGDCIKELLDKALYIENNQKKINNYEQYK